MRFVFAAGNGVANVARLRWILQRTDNFVIYLYADTISREAKQALLVVDFQNRTGIPRLP